MSQLPLPRASYFRRGLPIVLCGLWIATAPRAQRQEVPAPVATGTTKTFAFDTTQGHDVAAKTGPVIEQPGDEPDYRPYREVDVAEGSKATRVLEPIGDPYVLACPSGDYKPEPGVDPRIRTVSGEFVYGYVMVEGQMNKQGRRQALEALGCEILGVHTWQCWVARFPKAIADRLVALDFVRWVGMAQPWQKVDPKLTAILSNATAELVDVEISTFTTDLGPKSERIQDRGPLTGIQTGPITEAITRLVPNGPFQAELQGAGMKFTAYTDIDNVHIFHGKITKADLVKIVDLPFVAYVEPRPEHRTAHDQSMGMTHQDLLRNSYGGRGITVGVIDTGYHYQHLDLSSLAVGWDTVGTGPYDDANGHGSHVAGTMIGRGNADARYKGALPTTATDGTDRIFIGRYLNASGSGTGDVSTLYAALSSSYTNSGLTSPRPQSINNSWGAYSTSGYNGADSSSRTVDGYVFSYNQLYCFAAGNEGATAYVRTPGAAKNVLTVGGTQDYTSGTSYAGDVYSASSGGGVTDGRRKPEILAPGTIVTSCLTKTTNGYTNKSGTSMATPHITAAAGALVDAYTSTFSYLPARIKAHLTAATEWGGYPGSTSGWYGTRLGMGQIDCRKLPGSSETTWFSVGNISSSTNGVTWYSDITMPSDAEAIKFCGSWIEAAASASATKARVNDVRFMFDVAPFNTPSSPGTGDISMSSSADNILTFARTGTTVQGWRGQTFRIWIWGASVSSTIRPGWTLMIDKDLQGSGSTLSGSVPTRVLPNTNFTASLTLTTPTNVADFNDARLWLTASGFTFVDMKRTTLDSILQTYSGTAYPSYPYPSLTNGMTVGAGTTRSLSWTLRSPSTSGSYTLTGNSRSNPVATRTVSLPICVDGLAPANIANLRSTSHTVSTWSNNTTLAMAWNAAVDNGCAGIYGIATRTDLGSAATPTVRNLGNVTSQNVTVSSNTQPYWFAARAVDNLSNFSTSTTTSGPYYIDSVAPTISGVTINDNAAATNSLTVTVKGSASDTHSGVNQIRFSSNNSTWSAWQALAASYSYNLSSNGGNTNQGTKTVYVQVRDRAGNVSSTASDSIIYDSIPPTVTLVQLGGGAAATATIVTTLRVSGSGSPTEMRFSSNNSTWSTWSAYSTATLNYNLSSNGGNSALGTKTCYCQMRDSVGNISTTASDSIEYVGTPSLSNLTPSTVYVVNKQAVRLNGNNLSVIKSVTIGSTTITSNDDQDWAKGYFRIVSNTAIDFYTPQALAPGNYSVFVSNSVMQSGNLTLTIAHNPTPFAGSPVRKQRGGNIDVIIHRGNQPGTVISVLTVSGSGTPLNIPGLVSLGHGGNPVTIIDPSLLVIAVGAHDATTRAASFAVPAPASLPAVPLYFESLFIDTLNPNRQPIPSSGATSTLLF